MVTYAGAFTPGQHCWQQKREKAFVNVDNIHVGNMLTTKCSFPSVIGKHQRNDGNICWQHCRQYAYEYLVVLQDPPDKAV
jgi:hypothetical protein